MAIDLTEQQRDALEKQHGFVQGPSYVLMSTDAYRRMMGVDTDDEMNESLRAIERALSDIEAGRTRPFREVLAELGAEDDVSS